MIAYLLLADSANATGGPPIEASPSVSWMALRALLRPWILTLCAAACLACAPPEGPARPPNIVFILADDLGWADTGFQGSTFYRTPHLDALARNGLVFSNSYSAAPVCSPSRAAIQTGLAPARTHFTTNILSRRQLRSEAGEGAPGGPANRPLWGPHETGEIPDAAPTIAGVLSAAGYRTAMLGKWHVGTHPRDAGYQLIRGPTRGAKLESYFPPYFAAALETFPDGPPGEYMTDRLTDEALAFIEESRDRPFFLYLSHFAPHSPFQAKPELEREFQAHVDPTAPQHNPTYAAMIASLDQGVGRIVDALERLGLSENTLIVFTSDNGGWETRRANAREGPEYHITSNLPLRAGKGRLYEGGVRVPTIFAGAGVRHAGRTCDTPIVALDFLPTFAALADVAIASPLDGLDLGPLLQDEGELQREALYFHFPHQAFHSSLRVGDAKLLHFFGDGHDELYDLTRDPGETHDLAPEDPARAAALRKRLLDWLESVGAALPITNPDYVPGGEQESGDPDSED